MVLLRVVRFSFGVCLFIIKVFLLNSRKVFKL